MDTYSFLELFDGNTWEKKVDPRKPAKASTQVWLDDDLCEECLAGDVRGIILCRTEKESHDLGPLYAIKRRQQFCWLCHTVNTLCDEALPQDVVEALLQERATPINLFQDRFALGTTLVSDSLDLPCAMLKPFEFGGPHPNEWIAAYEVFTHYRIEFALNEASGHVHIPFTHAFTYEERSRYVNYNQVAGWLQTCSSRHRICRQLQEGRNIMDKLYLIDVHSRQVKIMGANTAYVALSYTWGDARVQRSVEYSSMPLVLGQPFYFPRSLPRKAPATVEDAITAVKDLGERYLWTDLYCINQSDPTECREQIRGMDGVYESALLTICAISSSSSTAGIEGISKPWQPVHQITTRIQSGYLQITGNLYFSNDLKDSIWRTRAWTFQECKLANRKLCFGAHGLFMWCSEELFHHAIADPNPDHHTAMKPDNPRNPQMYAAFEPLGLASMTGADVSETFVDFGLYVKLINEFCRRHLTFEGDAHNAIAGLLHRLATIYNAQFVFGLPMNQLTRALLWSCGPCMERPRRPDFPSWTWLGWNADPTRTKVWGEQPEYEYWLEDEPQRATPDGRMAYKLRVFWLEQGRSPDIVIVVASEASTLASNAGSQTLEIRAQTANCSIRCFARHNESVSGNTAEGQPLDGQLARGDIWEIHNADGEPMPREVILDTDGEQTENYTFEISPELSSKLDSGKNSSGCVKMILLQRWVEIDQKTGEPEETSWGDRGWFLIVLIGDGNRAERIALVNMEFEKFEDMCPKEEHLMLV